jgi:hypothetical protein
MKITLTHSEAAQIIASHYSGQLNVLPEDVSINVPVVSTTTTSLFNSDRKNTLDEKIIRESIISLYREGAKSNAASKPIINRIALIRAIRALTGCGLYDAKTFLEDQVMKE